ncbi:MAG: amidase [Acidimicrobiales bacterium]
MTASDSPLDLDATAQAALVRDGTVSPTELVDLALQRIDSRNPALNAVIHRRDERARAEAVAVDLSAPFAGVPMVLKDLMCELADEPFHEGMQYLSDLDYRPPADQTLARRFKEAGFVIVGKSNTSELGGMPTTEPLLYGPTHNPWLPDHTPSGSSGGSAAAVASRMVAIGHANDAGGSIRSPAARCGLVGLKPSRGRVPLGPLYGDLFGSVVAELAVTRSVRDTAKLLDAVSGPEPGDPFAVHPSDGSIPRPLRVGVWSGVPGGFGSLSPEAASAVSVAADTLSDLGHSVSEAHPPILDRRTAAAVLGKIVMVGTDWAIRRWEKLTGEPCADEQVEPITRMYLREAQQMSATDLLDLTEAGQLVTRQVAEWYAGGFDLLLTATVAEPPSPHGELQAFHDDEVDAVMTRILPSLALTSWANLTGQPAISLPLHWTDGNVPMGSQLIAKHGREDLLLSVAAELETALPWADRYDELAF